MTRENNSSRVTLLSKSGETVDGVWVMHITPSEVGVLPRMSVQSESETFLDMSMAILDFLVVTTDLADHQERPLQVLLTEMLARPDVRNPRDLEFRLDESARARYLDEFIRPWRRDWEHGRRRSPNQKLRRF